MFGFNKKYDNPHKLKALAVSYKNMFLDDKGELTVDGRAVLRDLVSFSGLLKTDDNAPRSGRDVAIYLLQTIYGGLDYYDELIKEYALSEREDII